MSTIICWYIMGPMDAPKRGRGRPPVENGERLYLTIRVSEARKASYEAAAKRAGEALSAWVKRILDRASRR